MNKQRGFTLVELSIVLVILGLLVGGVLTGQSLIHAAELRALTQQEQRYIAATQTFRDKYFALPGDMTNATSYWGQAASGTSCFTTAGTGTQTCNGDGDGLVGYEPNANESFRFWQQLANGGLVEGNYTGVQDGTDNYSATRNNSPVARINNVIWFPYGYGTITGVSWGFTGTYGNTLAAGPVLANASPSNDAMKPEDLYNIDVKMDDGKPATGNVVVFFDASTNCTSASATTDLTAIYLLNSSAQQVVCSPVWRNAF